MKRTWNKQEINKALRQMAKASPEKAVFDRVWFKLEERLDNRTKHFWDHVVWKPLRHPVSWLAATCLFLAFSGVFYRQNSIHNSEEMATYLMSVSNPASGVNRDLGMVNVSVLLSGPSVSTKDLLKTTDEDHFDILVGDDILL